MSSTRSHHILNLASLVTLLGLALQIAHAQNPAPPTPQPQATTAASRTKSSLLAWIYRLVWPAGRFSGDLVRTVERNTQKSASNPDTPRLYLVTVGTSTAMEWPTGRGAMDPVVCPTGGMLYYRRDVRILAEPLHISDGRVTSAGQPTTLTSVEAASLVACTVENGTSLIWIQTREGTVIPLERREASLTASSTVDRRLRELPAPELADYLRIMRSLRPDGVAAAVLNKSLVQEGVGRQRAPVIEDDELLFFGVPAWVPRTDSLFVVAEKTVSQ